jgi:hypothetical protein
LFTFGFQIELLHFFICSLSEAIEGNIESKTKKTVANDGSTD